MGLGKTICALMLRKTLSVKMVVVCPAYVKGVWKAESAKWTSEAKVVECKGTKPQPLPEFDIAVINYDILWAWQETLIAAGIKLVVFDEAHVAVEEKSRRAQAMRADSKCLRLSSGLDGHPFYWPFACPVERGRYPFPRSFR